MIRSTLLKLAFAGYCLLQLKGFVELLRSPGPDWSGMTALIAALLPWLVILAAAYVIWRAWRAFKAGVRHLLAGFVALIVKAPGLPVPAPIPAAARPGSVSGFPREDAGEPRQRALWD